MITTADYVRSSDCKSFCIRALQKDLDVNLNEPHCEGGCQEDQRHFFFFFFFENMLIFTAHPFLALGKQEICSKLCLILEPIS